MGETPKTPSERSSKKSKAVVGIAVLALLAGLGNTLAANISLNSDASVEFGQGVAQTSACDSSITVMPQTTFVNATQSFDMTSVELSGVDLTPEGTGWDATGSGVTDVTGGFPDEWNNWSGHGSDFNGVPNGTADQWDAVYLHPGQYFNGTNWVNTCADKTLFIKAYTDNSLYASHTLDETDTSSALCFTSDVAHEVADVYNDTYKTNCGIGINIHGYKQTGTSPVAGSNLAYYGADAHDLTSIYTEVTGTTYDNSTVTIFFNNDQVAADAAVLDGKWVSKFTIESMAPPSSPSRLDEIDYHWNHVDDPWDDNFYWDLSGY